MTELSIIVLSYNTSEITIRCLTSITENYSNQLKNKQFEIIVVDNSSADDSVWKIKEFVKKTKSNIKFIENRENLGFGAGNNVGAKHAKATYCLFLNSDTVVKDQGLVKMTDFLKSHKGIGIAGGKLYNHDGSAQASVGNFYTLWTLFLTLFGGERLGFLRESPNSIKKVDWVSGAFMMVDKDAFEKSGMFDENIFMYVEDMELCYRMSKNGFGVYYFPDTNVIHEKIGSSSREFAIVSIYKGVLYFFRKHKSRFEYEIARVFLILKANLAIGIGLITGNTSLTKMYKKALSF